MNTPFTLPTIDTLFSLHVHPLAWVMAGVAIVCGLLVMLIIIPRMRRVAARVEADSQPMPPVAEDPTHYPPLSVIVTTDDDGPRLANLLTQLFAQDYPAPYEVIVVDIADNKETADVISLFQRTHPNLYLTFAPGSARNLSRKKLAVTLGVKAAANDCLLLTEGCCSLPTAEWMRRMARHFAAGRQVVVGYSRQERIPEGPVRRAARRRAFDMERSAVRWLYPAAKGYPTRADRCNLGFLRSTFLNHKGYSRHFDLIRGDDDVFIREITTRTNAALELSRQSMVTQWVWDVAKTHRRDLMQRNFTARFLRRLPRLPWKLTQGLWWLWFASCVVSIAVAMPSLITLCGLTAFNVAFCLSIGFCWRRAARALGLRPLCLTVPWLALNHPIYAFGCHLHKDGLAAYHYIYQQELAPKA